MNNKQCQNIVKLTLAALVKAQDQSHRLYLEETNEFINAFDFDSDLEFEKLYEWEGKNRPWKQARKG